MQNVDVALVPTGGLPTIELDDLYQALEKIEPRITIPMHHALPGCKFPAMLEASEFADHYPDEAVVWHEWSEVEITRETLPSSPQVWLLKAANADYGA